MKFEALEPLARLTEAERFAERAAWVRSERADSLRARRHAFFLDVDLETAPSFEDVPTRERERLGLTRERWQRSVDGAAQLAGGPGGPGLLKQRLEERARAARCGKEPAPMAPTDLLDAVRHLSLVLLETVERHLGQRSDPRLIEEVAEAFEAFAGGELLLRLEKPGGRFRLGGEPDSAFFFFWAEFAALCVDLGVDAETWDRLLSPLVAAQQVFLCTYAPRPRLGPDGRPCPARFADYGPGNVLDPTGASRPSQLERKALRSQHAGLDRRQLLERVGRRARADLGLS